MKIYCTECGSPIEYSEKKPNFCDNCGYNFITKAKTQTLLENSEKSEKSLDVDSEENDVKSIDPRVYQMVGLDVDIDMSKPSTLTFGDLFPEVDQEGDEKQKN